MKGGNKMRLTGTEAYGIRLPIISPGDDLVRITADAVCNACEDRGLTIKNDDVIGITEAVVAKSQGNYASLKDIAADIRNKFPSGDVGVVFPILSRNRFLNILKGVALGADKVYVLLNYPSDEVGNPLMDTETADEIFDALAAFKNKPISAADFKNTAGAFPHPFTGIDYIDLYENCSPKIKIYVSDDAREILKLTKNVLVAEIHNRFRTKERILRAGAEKVYCLSDVLSSPVNGSGFNPDYGVLGSNISSDESLKLFPRESGAFVNAVRDKIKEKTGVSPEILVYGDGAFKDPACGIWELADPVVSPGYTKRLSGRPNELKLKYIADNDFKHLTGESKTKAVTDMIKAKTVASVDLAEGTTPRKYADLLGSLCDLMSGSGDKGTPVILIKGYFDNYSVE